MISPEPRALLILSAERSQPAVSSSAVYCFFFLKPLGHISPTRWTTHRFFKNARFAGPTAPMEVQYLDSVCHDYQKDTTRSWHYLRRQTLLWKYSIVRFIPSCRSTFGSQPSSVRARVMSGRRTFGSSCGSGLKTISHGLPSRP
jgi:hypothetical protein